MRIGIVGAGLIGGSFAMAIRACRKGDEILISDTDPETAARARLLNLTDGLLDGRSLSTCDLVLLSLYPGACVAWLKEHAAELRPGALVVDAAGIKREICAVGAALAREHGFHFVGGHPMAGREVWGLSAASPELFRGASMILTPAPDSSISVLAELKSFFLSLGFGRVTIGTPEEHDRIIAYTSQLAHILSSAYVESPTADLHRGYSAGSFRDMTRVAAINAEMWSEIFLKNKEALIGEIDGLVASLTAFRDVILADDQASLADMLARGAKRKAELNKPNVPRS